MFKKRDRFKIFMLIIASLCILSAIPTPGNADDMDLGISGGLWLPGTIDVEGVDVDKNLGFLVRLFVDSYIMEKMCFGAYINFAQPEVEYRSYKEDGTMYELGVAMKYRMMPGNMPLKIGLNIGYRKLESDMLDDDVQGLGVNLSAELLFGSNKNFSPFAEAGFLTQPSGGNDDADVTWGPIFYIAGGIIF